jgi:hypothetical protein
MRACLAEMRRSPSSNPAPYNSDYVVHLTHEVHIIKHVCGYRYGDDITVIKPWGRAQTTHITTPCHDTHLWSLVTDATNMRCLHPSLPANNNALDGGVTFHLHNSPGHIAYPASHPPYAMFHPMGPNLRRSCARTMHAHHSMCMLATAMNAQIHLYRLNIAEP